MIYFVLIKDGAFQNMQETPRFSGDMNYLQLAYQFFFGGSN